MNPLDNSLIGRVLGISISESSDLDRLGFSERNFRDALIEISRSILARGATIAYGGDPGESGFTHALFDLVGSFKGAGGIKANRIKNYLAWPIHLKLTLEERAELESAAEIIALPAPDVPGLDADVFLPPTDVENIYAWCISLTRMRKRLARDVDAQILMGGRLIGYKGKYPGLVEEAYETMKAETPLFLIGAYGGCTGAVIEAIRGNRPAALTQQQQCKDNAYWEVYRYYNQHAPADEERIDYEELVNFFNQRGIDGIENGLSAEENERLFTTPHMPEIISLVLQGLIAAQS